MAGINDYSNTAGSNTTINGIDISEGCSPAGINNAIRQLMADIADMDDGVVPLQTPDINGGTIDGATIGGSSTIDSSIIGGTTPAAGTFTTLTANTSITGTLNTAAQTNITSVGTLSALTVSGDLTVDTNTLYVDSSNNRVGVGTNSPARRFHIHESSASTASHLVMTTANTGLTTGDGFNLSVDGTSSNVNFIQRENADMAFYTNGGTNERMRIDSSGKVGIGTSSPIKPLTVGLDSGSSVLAIQRTNSNASGSCGGVGFARETGYFNAAIELVATSTTSGDLVFRTEASSTETDIFNVSERMRIQSNGAVKIGTPAFSSDTPGLGNSDQGVCFRGSNVEQFFINSNNTPCFIGRTADGSIVAFQSAGTQEGSINISGATVSYNGFTGTHWSRLVDNSKPTILKGTILESLDEMMDWYNLQFDITKEDGSTYSQRVPHILQDGQSVGDTVAHTYEGTDYQATIVKEADIKHTKSKISDTVDAKNVYGVFVDWDNDDDTINDMYVAQTGTFVIRINGSETVSKGDLIQSNGDGTGKVQSDDIIRASTVAKVISSTKIETYDDGSYIVPCTLHC